MPYISGGHRGQVDLGWLAELTTPTPDNSANPAAGATKPGDVDYRYTGDPEEAIKKYRTGPLKEPTKAQMIAFPEQSNRINAINTQYAARPAEEAQASGLQVKEMTNKILGAHKYATGEDLDPETASNIAKGMVANYTPTRVAQELKSKSYIEKRGPQTAGEAEANLSTAGKIASQGEVERAGKTEALKDIQLNNATEQAGVITPLEQELQEKMTVADIKRLPISNVLKDRLLGNELGRQDIETQRQIPERAMATKSAGLADIQADTLAKRLGVENIQATHPGAMENQFKMFNVNPGTSVTGQPAVSVDQSRNPFYQPPFDPNKIMASMGATNSVTGTLPGGLNIPGLPMKAPSLSTSTIAPTVAQQSQAGSINPNSVLQAMMASRGGSGVPAQGVAQPPVGNAPQLDPNTLQLIQRLLQSGGVRSY